jgi:hypothetical protein
MLGSGGALADANIRVKLQDAAGAYITPTKGLLANQETSMLLLSPDKGGGLYKLHFS